MTTLTGSSPQVVRIDLRDDAMRPVGELEVDVDPHGADFRPAITGIALPCFIAWGSTRAWLSAQCLRLCISRRACQTRRLL